MQRRMDPVQMVVADDGVLPTYGIVQGVRARVAPMAVEVVLGEHGARASEFEELVRRQKRRLSREDLRFSNGDLCFGDALWTGSGDGAIDGEARAIEQGACGAQTELEVA